MRKKQVKSCPADKYPDACKRDGVKQQSLEQQASAVLINPGDQKCKFKWEFT